METVKYTLNNTTFTFDRETGALESLDFPGVSSMVSGGKGLFDLAWPVHTDYDIQRANPTAPYRKCAPRFDFDGTTLTLTYDAVPVTMPIPDGMTEFDGGVKATVYLRACEDGKSVAMRIHIVNNSNAKVEQVLFPDINGIVPTMDEDHARLTMMGGSCNPFTELRSTPQSRETFFAWTESCAGRMYEAGGFQQGPYIGRWYDMGSRKGGFSMYRRHWGWGPDDPEKKHMGYSENLWVKLDNRTKKLRIAALRYTDVEKGGEYDSGEYVLTAHKGTWIEGVGAYKEYALSNIHRVVDVPQRAKEMLGFRTIFMSNGYPKDPTDYCWKYDDMPKIAEDMVEHGLYDMNVWGQFWYFLPFSKDLFYPEWGGFDNWKKNADTVRSMGVTITPLVSWISAWSETAERYGIHERSGSWAETPKSIPMFKAKYCQRWSCYQHHDHDLPQWQQDIREGLRFIRDVCGCPDICWDQYVLGDNNNEIIHDIINEYREETEKMYPGSLFSSECTLWYESDVDNTDFTWNWLYWPGRGDFRPYMHIIRTLRPNMNVDSTPSYVKFIFMDNLMMNVYPSRPEDYNGSALISEYPEFSKAVKTCARLRKEYLSYFVDGLMISDCAVDGDIPCRVTGYLKEDTKDMLMIVYKHTDGEVTLPFNFDYFTDRQDYTYTVKDEEDCVLAEGKIGRSGEITFSGNKDMLYMIEIK